MKPVLKVVIIVFSFWIVAGISCKKNNKDAQSNRRPVAIAGPDEIITLPANSTNLDGAGSTDDDGKIVKWQWAKISGPSIFILKNASTAIAEVTGLVEGAYLFQLVVTDDGGLSAADTVRVQVKVSNRPPIAKAGADFSLALCTDPGVATLNGKDSYDPDNDQMTYTWTKISGAASSTLSFATTSAAKAENLLAGQYVYELKVTDIEGLSSKDTVVVNVLGRDANETNLDLVIDGSCIFQDNYADCYYNPCSYYDYTIIEGKFSLPSIASFDFWASEYADTATIADGHDSYWHFYSSGNGPSLYGNATINFKKLIQKGGGAFSGTFKVNGGSATRCNKDIFISLDPLAVTGTIDTAAKKIRLTIKGKTYF